MGIVLLDMAMSLDGVITDANGQSLYPIADLRHTEALNCLVRTTGAVIMDRAAYDLSENNFTGFPFQVPLFILTDAAPPESPNGENDHLRCYFITEGIAKTVEYAKQAAGDLNVTVIGGPAIARLCIKAAVLDEILVRHIPILVGKGIRLFEDFGDMPVKLKIFQSTAFVNRIDVRYRVMR